ncbi:MAG: sortase [Anaerolineae bacterium]
MRDRRTVDELTIEELEEILVLKRMEARTAQRRRLAESGRLLASEGEPAAPPAREAGKRFLPPRDISPRPQKTERRNLARIRDTFLLILEILALAGLLIVLGSSLWDLRTLNREVAQAREPLPTPTATPFINVTILPGSSSPPQQTGSLPEQFRNLVQPMAPMPIPTPGPQSPTRIVIPKIGVDAAVVEGDSWEQLKKGPGHHIGSANPGERGNVVISGHNDVFGEPFRDLEKLDLNDEVVVYAGVQPYRYVVRAKRIVEPTEVSVMADTSAPTLTLITCYPYLVDTHRLVVIAALEE